MREKFFKKSKKFLKFLIIFLIIASWVFSGWPRIWQNPRIPSQIQKALAIECGFGTDIGGGVCRGFLTTTGGNQTFTSPSDWNNSNNEIEAIGAGGSGASGTSKATGGGGGAYSLISNFSFATPGVTTATYRVGATTTAVSGTAGNTGEDTWFNDTVFPGAGTDNAKVGAKGGGGGNLGTAAQVGGAGGVDTAGYGETRRSGGAGGAASSGNAGHTAATGGGGAAGDTAIGGNGVEVTANGVSAGGQANGSGATGGSAAGGGGAQTGGYGNPGTEWSTEGSGGGGGGGRSTNGGAATGGNGGVRGGGGGGAMTSGTATSGAGGQGVIVITYTPAVAPTTYLGNDTDPGVNPTIAPGAATTTVGTFNLKTSSGSDTVTTATTTLSAGSSGGLFGVEITSSDNATIYCSSYNPASDTVELFGCNLPVTSASTTFNIRIKPKTHAAMDAPPGSTYSVTATITSITGTNQTSGADTTSDTVTIDNESPNGATATSGTAGDQKVTLNWTTSDSGDFDTTSGSVILRWAAGAAGSEVPLEGKSDYAAGNTIDTATVACVISSPVSNVETKIDGSGGSAGCTTDVLTNGQQYTYVAFQRDTNGNYDVGVSIGTFTPAGVSLTFTIDTNSISFVTAITPGTPVSTSSVLTVNTNNSAGYNIKIERASSTETLFLTTDPSTRIADNPNGNNWTAPAATSTAGPSAVWTDGTTKGLGFRVKQTGTAVNTYSSTWWGTSDASANALYSGISTSTLLQKIADTTLGSGSDEKTTVEYRVDVAGTQKSGAYTSSPIIYTALAN